MFATAKLEVLCWGNKWSEPVFGHLAAVAGLGAMSVMAAVQIIPTFVLSQGSSPEQSRTAPVAGLPKSAATTARQWAFGGYGGVSYTHPEPVHILNPGRTGMTVKDFSWIGRPFKSPIYYGVRIQRWQPDGQFGSMLDFTHAKAISTRSETATFSGRLNGQPLKEKQRIGDVFRHLEFSHGHNMLTLNGLARLTPSWSRFRPYVGGGAGISLPHTEVGLHTDNTRTFEYQFAGLVAQGLAGIEIQLGRASLFFEYKFSYAPYDIPLSHEPRGWLLVTDLWRQISAWLNNERPPGGRLTTTLATHHGIFGVMVKGPAVSGQP